MRHKVQSILQDNRNRKFIITFCFNLIMFMCAYGALGRDRFNGDTLDALAYPEMQSTVYVSAGRYLFALVWEFFFRIGKDLGRHIGANTIATIFLMAIATTVITCAIIDVLHTEKAEECKLKRYLFIDSIAMISFLNLLALELLFFGAYTLTAGLSCFFVSFAIFAFSKKKYVLSVIFLTCTIMVYQAYVGVFIIYTLFLIFVEYKGVLNKQSFGKSGIVVLVSGSICVFDMVSVRLLAKLGIIPGAAKKLKVVRLTDVFKSIVNAELNVLKTEYCLSMFRYLPFILLLVAGLIVLLCYIKQKKKLGDWIYLILLVTASHLCIFSTVFGGQLYVPPRVLCSYWSFISVMLLLASYLWKQTITDGILLFLVGVTTILHIINSNIIISDLYVSNALDMNYTATVQSSIEKYESQTGNTVTKLGVCTDENCKQYWEEFVDYYNYNINERCVSRDWHLRMLLDFYSGRDYQKSDIPEDVYAKYFEGKDWEYFDASEQLIFDNDTVYIAVY